MTTEWTPEDRLRMTREREHVASAIVQALSDWRGVLEVVETAASVDEAQEALSRSFGFTQVQATAVLDAQFRRVSRPDRDRLAAELEQLRREIKELGDGT